MSVVAIDREQGRRLLLFATVAYACGLGFVLFQPSNGVPSSSIAFISRHLLAWGWPVQFSGFAYVDFWCNVLITIPLAASTVMLRPRWAWDRVTVIAFGCSASVEVTQAMFFPHRVPAFSDVVGNTLGVLIGAGGVAVARLLSGGRTGFGTD